MSRGRSFAVSLTVSALVLVMVTAACGRRGGPPREQASAGAASAPTVIVQAPAAEPAAGAAPASPEAAALAEAVAAAAWFRAHYTKYEYRIPMRDGVRLFTAVYVPNDAGPGRKYPFLMSRTPYSVAPYGTDRYPEHADDISSREGYIFVLQDVRGRYMSEGTFDDVRPLLDTRGPKDTDESTDTADTIDWLIAHVEHNNGKVGILGQSYNAFYATAAATSGHPALAAVVAMAPIGDWWIGDDMHRNGAFSLQMVFTFFSRFHAPVPKPIIDENFWPGFDYGTPDAYQFYLDLGPLSELDATDLKTPSKFWDDAKAHPDYDAFWQARNILPRLKNVKAAVLVVGGWYDTEDLYGSLGSYQSIERQNPRGPARLWMGPWKHGGWWTAGSELGDTKFGFPTAATYRERLNAYFKHYLKGGPDPGLPEAEVFETGANRWRKFATWPPQGTVPTTYYLRGDGGLAAEPPADADPAAAFDEYISDPARPVPYTANPTTPMWSAEYMAEDQRFASRRPDVLVYQSAPLERDLTIAGPIDVELFVSTTGTDADFVVKLVDAWPGKLPGQRQRDLDDDAENHGAQQLLVRGELMRARYRNSLERPEPLVAGQVAKLTLRLDDVFHTFQRGHRVMIQVQSSWFPFMDRNPQTFVPSIYEAKRADFVKATHRVHRATAAASKITFGRLPAADEAP
jgi:hypothetical protein